MSHQTEHAQNTASTKEGCVVGELVETDDDVIGLDEIFETLKNQRRRHTIRYLGEIDGQVTLSDLAEEIAGYENDKAPAQVSSKERKRVYVGLYQCHLPKMDDMGVVSFDRSRGTIEPSENTELVREYLPNNLKGREEETGWSRIHPRTNMCPMAFVGTLGAIGLFILGLLSQPGLLVFITIVVVALGLTFARDAGVLITS